MKLKEDLEKEVTEKHVFIKKTSIYPMVTSITNWALAEATKDNIVGMYHKK